MLRQGWVSGQWKTRDAQRADMMPLIADGASRFD
jgi:hypothetical protein